MKNLKNNGRNKIKYEKFKNNKGITMISLIVMIIVISILAGISITEGTALIKQVKVDNYKTNMISIKAKAKVIAEEVNSKTWDISAEEKSTKRQELFKSDYAMESVTISNEQQARIRPSNR